MSVPACRFKDHLFPLGSDRCSSCGAPRTEALAGEPAWLQNLWSTDAPEGMCWKCPDCDHRASLGGNAGYHVTQTGHGAPTCVPLPKTQRGQGGLHVERGILYAFLDNDPAVERYITPAWCCEFDGRREYFPRCPVKDALLAASKVLGVEVVLRPDAFSHFLEKRVAEEQQAKDFRKVAEILRGLGFGGDLDGVTDLLREWRERGATLGPGWEG